MSSPLQSPPRRSSPDLPVDAFDVVVIGSGMGGLSAALLLAKEGMKVCVLEQHYRPGGCLHRFFREKVPYDTGFHYFGGVGKEGVLARYLRYLGVMDRLRFHSLDPDGFDVLQFPGLTFRVPNGWEPLARRLKDHFPKEKAAIDRYVEACRTVCDDSPFYSFRGTVDSMKSWPTAALGPFLKSLTADERLRAVVTAQGWLYGVAPEVAPLALHALVIDSMLQGAAGIDGGGDALAQVMVSAIRGHGGVVRTSARVEALEVAGGRVTAARLAGGEAVHARTFVSNAHPRSTLALLPPEAVTPAYRHRIADLKDGIGCAAGYFVYEGDAASRHWHNVYVYPNFDIDSAYRRNGFGRGQAEEKVLFVTFPADRDPSWKGQRVVLVMGLMAWDEVAKWENTKTGKRGQEYEAFKDGCGEAMQAVTERHVPDLAGRLRRVEFSTPLTNRDYTGAPHGAIYGIRRSMDQWGRYALHPRTRLENLLLTGQNILMPGVVGVTVGAFVTCGFLLGFDHLYRKVARA